jgi:hypothetical protein
MSYDIYIYEKSVKNVNMEDENIDPGNFPKIPREHVEKFKSRLLKYDYQLAHEGDDSVEYEHKNSKWGIQVSIFENEISFSVPYWDDSENAIFEALMTASELCDHGELVAYDPQNGSWVEA